MSIKTDENKVELTTDLVNGCKGMTIWLGTKSDRLAKKKIKELKKKWRLK